jgi:hypothetical protein
MLGLAEGRPLSSQKTIGKSDRLLERLEGELARVEVPLSYSSELYELHMHLRYMIERMHALQRRTTAGPQVG